MESISSNNIWSHIKMGNVLHQVLLLLFSFLNQTKSDDDPGLAEVQAWEATSQRHNKCA
jgi:hypothetical protein